MRHPLPVPDTDADVVRRLAGAHLPPEVAARWWALLRPAVRLRPASPGRPVVARFGGLPLLPDIAWPEWPDHGPLSYIGELHCAAFAEHDLDLPLPSEGRLLFFYFDGSFDDFASTVGTWDAGTLAGARVLHVPHGAPAAARVLPAGTASFSETHLDALPVVTAPNWEHPVLRAAFLRPGEDDRSFLDHPVNAEAFQEALGSRHAAPAHQVGGYADAEQGPVELEVAHAALGNAVDRDDPRLVAEAARWRPLLQVGSDEDRGMVWGDVGTLYWLTRGAALRAGDVSDVSFTWQCG